MKKIFAFCLCFLFFSSTVFAESIYDEECYSEPYLKDNKKVF